MKISCRRDFVLDVCGSLDSGRWVSWHEKYFDCSYSIQTKIGTVIYIILGVGSVEYLLYNVCHWLYGEFVGILTFADEGAYPNARRWMFHAIVLYKTLIRVEAVKKYETGNSPNSPLCSSFVSPSITWSRRTGWSWSYSYTSYIAQVYVVQGDTKKYSVIQSRPTASNAVRPSPRRGISKVPFKSVPISFTPPMLPYPDFKIPQIPLNMNIVLNIAAPNAIFCGIELLLPTDWSCTAPG